MFYICLCIWSHYYSYKEPAPPLLQEVQVLSYLLTVWIYAVSFKAYTVYIFTKPEILKRAKMKVH